MNLIHGLQLDHKIPAARPQESTEAISTDNCPTRWPRTYAAIVVMRKYNDWPKKLESSSSNCFSD